MKNCKRYYIKINFYIIRKELLRIISFLEGAFKDEEYKFDIMMVNIFIIL